MIKWRTDVENAPKSEMIEVPNTHPKAKKPTKTVLSKKKVLLWSKGMVQPSLTYWLPEDYDGFGGGGRWNGYSKGVDPEFWSEFNTPEE